MDIPHTLCTMISILTSTSCVIITHDRVCWLDRRTTTGASPSRSVPNLQGENTNEEPLEERIVCLVYQIMQKMEKSRQTHSGTSWKKGLVPYGCNNATYAREEDGSSELSKNVGIGK